MKKTIALLTLLSFCLLSAGQAASAAPDPDGTRLLQTVFTDNETSLTGMRSSKQKLFQIPDYWNVQEVNLKLDYVVTPLAKELISSVTLWINGKPFHSFRPGTGEKGLQQLTIAVPKEWLKQGDNTIEIQGYVRTEDQQACSIVEAPDQWLQLHNTSSIDVRYTSLPMEGTIADFAKRFAGPDTVYAGGSVITVPDRSETAELEAAVHVLSGFAKLNSWDDKDIPLFPYSAEALKEKELVVLVGLYDRLPEEIRSLIGSEEMSGKAWLRLLNQEGQPMLVVTSQNAELLKKAARLTANPELMSQIAGEAKAVDESTDVSTPAVSFSSRVSFTENGDELKGPHHQERSYYINLPANRSIADSGRISLDYRYSQNLDFNRSLVTVSINDTPIGSKKLTKEMANGDRATFAIPTDLKVSGNFAVTVGFDLEMIDAACTQNEEQTPWAYISNESMIDFKTKDRTELLFNHYPYPFLRDGAYNQVAVVLPQERDAYTYRTFSNLFNLLGRYAVANTGDVKVYPDTAQESELKDRNIIAIGTYQDNKWIRDQNKNLYFQYDDKGTAIRSNEKKSIDSEYGARIGTLQLLPSPFSSSTGMLAVTGARSESYYLASKLLATEKAKWSVYGDGVTADKDGNVNAYRFKKQAGEKTDSVIADIAKRSDVLGFLAAVGLAACLALVSLVLLIRKYRKK
ncbi:cellulose biosynthesis cyclic di-GMP-binding regulatory protein BcsB [Paenibacillus sp. GCM10012303]|uniref:cellulose biosynthesis cyclic di-GMP-binding regulatory protein BcsB n=1 Tax=Paenibacillus sp. GCM10012303 TaxID=3317340 RepID=UPI00360E3337